MGEGANYFMCIFFYYGAVKKKFFLLNVNYYSKKSVIINSSSKEKPAVLLSRPTAQIRHFRPQGLKQNTTHLCILITGKVTLCRVTMYIIPNRILWRVGSIDNYVRAIRIKLGVS